MSIIIGYKNPRFRCTAGGDAPGAPVIIDLPLTNSKGLIERNIPLTIEDDKLNYSEDIYTEGYHKQWTLNYDEQIDGATIMLIQALYEYFKNGYRIQFFPRSDNTSYFYDVNLKSDFIEFGIRSGYNKAKGMRLPVLIIKTKSMTDSFNWNVVVPPGTEVYAKSFPMRAYS